MLIAMRATIYISIIDDIYSKSQSATREELSAMTRVERHDYDLDMHNYKMLNVNLTARILSMCTANVQQLMKLDLSTKAI